MRGNRYAPVALLTTFLLLSGPSTSPAVEIDEYAELFHGVLDNLVTNFWSEDGNWQGDAMYDASVLAPRILYRYGYDQEDQDLIDKANRTVDRNVDLMMDAFTFQTPNFTEAFVAASCIGDATAYYSGEEHRFFPFAPVGFMGLWVARAVVTAETNPAGEYFGYVFTLGAYAYGTLAFDPPSATMNCTSAAWAVDAIETANESFWIELTIHDKTYGAYHDPDPCHPYSEPMSLFANGSMFAALAYAYGETGDQSYLEKADALLASFDAILWDHQRGGYTAHLYEREKKSLSSNSAIVGGLLDLYDYTGEARYLERAREVLDFIETDLVIRDWYHPDHIICAHHWEDVGPVNHYCTGCNFGVLTNIYRLNELAH